jgi:RNA polymerase subunit RPABC4/transcription elongation factor Spt4
LDPDGDLLSNLIEFQCGSNPNSIDSDSDSMDDYYEYINDLSLISNDAYLDLDGDGLTNIIEFTLNSAANNIDSDNDQMPDGYEYNYGLDLLSDDSLGDLDSDNLQNILEYFLTTDPSDPDTDNDGLNDGSERLTYDTDPLNADTDGDGYNDGLEVSMGTNPLDPKFSLSTTFLNIFGGILISITGLYAINKYRSINKKPQKPLNEPGNFNLKMNTKDFEALHVQKIKKPTPKKELKLSAYDSNYGLPYTPIKNLDNQVVDDSYSYRNVREVIRDILENKLPPPNSKYSDRGLRAMLFLNKAFELQNQGKMAESYDYLLKSLIMGVPEPYNSQIKKIFLNILKVDDQTTGSESQFNYRNNEVIQCSSCHHLINEKSKFCTNCGSPVQIQNIKVQEYNEKSEEYKICKNCYHKNPNDHKYCSNCGGVL